tara:strand:+ start:1366 stop:2220 length:855 start_codon:yes stop_codon:yes gene_type:complete
MIKTHNQQAFSDDAITDDTAQHTTSSITMLAVPAQLHLHSQMLAHHPRSGINPIVDAAGYLFTFMGELKTTKAYRPLSKLQNELIQEINTFQETTKSHGYNTEYTLVCRYVLCAAIDELIDSSLWGGQNHWDDYSLLGTYNQDVQHQEKFFSIMERAIKEPDYYIDLMELMYICLSMGYRGRYRNHEHNPAELEQITNSLYKHIRAYRGDFSKSLAPTPLKPPKVKTYHVRRGKESHWTIFLITACIIMTIFISLGYLMEMISNDAISKITDIQRSIASDTIQQ